MSVLLIISRENEDPLEFDVCCAYHARILAKRKSKGNWWEVVENGEVVDGADNEGSGGEGCGG